MGIERGIEQPFDTGHVEAAVFGVRVIAIYQQDEDSQKANERGGKAQLRSANRVLRTNEIP